MSNFSLIRSISNAEGRVMTLSLNTEGSLIAAIFEDDSDNKNKKYSIEVYDFNYDDPYQSSQTLFTKEFQFEKECLAWNPKRNMLAFGGQGEKDSSYLHVLVPKQEHLATPSFASLM